MSIKEFFEKYPNARFVWQVGDELYLANAKKKAVAKAIQKGLKLEKVENPKTAKAKGAAGNKKVKS